MGNATSRVFRERERERERKEQERSLLNLLTTSRPAGSRLANCASHLEIGRLFVRAQAPSLSSASLPYPLSLPSSPNPLLPFFLARLRHLSSSKIFFFPFFFFFTYLFSFICTVMRTFCCVFRQVFQNARCRATTAVSVYIRFKLRARSILYTAARGAIIYTLI